LYNALNANDIEQIKDSLTDFEPNSLNILKCYLLAKSCNLSRNNGDSLLHLIRTICPSPILSIPDSWSTVTRAINDQGKYALKKKSFYFEPTGINCRSMCESDYLFPVAKTWAT